MMFRGGALSPSTDKAYTTINLSEEGKKYMSEILGIRTDFDLRAQSENRAPDTPIESGLTVSPIPNANLEYYGVGGYDSGIANKEGYRKVFSALSDPSRYPIYIHCTGGADRTGTVSYLVNALLGVSKEDLIHDYEYTSFSIYGERNSRGGAYSFPALVSAIESYEGNTLSEKVESYLLSCGVTLDEIYNIKAIMLGKPTKVSVHAPTTFDAFMESKYQIALSGSFTEINALTMNGLEVPFTFTRNGNVLTVTKENLPSSLKEGKVECVLVIDNVVYNFAFTLSGNNTVLPLDFSNGSITLDTTKTRVTGKTIGYDGKIAKLSIQETAVHGGTYIFIGSYGFYIRGEAARVAERSGASFKESSPRKEAFAVRQASLRNGLILGISATILNDSTMRVELYDGSISLGRYDFPRVNDEIASEDAKFEMVISGDVTQAILSSPMQA